MALRFQFVIKLNLDFYALYPGLAQRVRRKATNEPNQQLRHLLKINNYNVLRKIHLAQRVQVPKQIMIKSAWHQNKL